MRPYKLIILFTILFLSCEDRIFLDPSPDVIDQNGVQTISEAGYEFDKAVLSKDSKLYEFFKCKEYGGDIELLSIEESGDHQLYLISGVDTVFSKTVYVSQTESEVLNITALDVKQGDSYIIDPHDGKISIIDGGYGSFGSYSWQDGGNSTLLDHLTGSGISELQYIIETHHDTDHFGGLSDIVTSGNFSYYQYLMNGSPELPAIGDTLFFSPEVKGVILHYGDIEKKEETEENDRSISILLMYNDFEMILTGDIETPAEEAILSRNILNVEEEYEILKVPHHGSSSSSSTGFLETIDPLISIISSGEGNPWNHPVPEIIDRLRQYTENIFRCDQCGNIQVYTNGYIIEIIRAQ